MGKIVIDTSSLVEGAYLLAKRGPKQFELVPMQAATVELDISEDTTYTLPAKEWLRMLVVIPTIDIEFSAMSGGQAIISITSIVAGTVEKFHVDLYAHNSDMEILFKGIRSPTKIIIFK